MQSPGSKSYVLYKFHHKSVAKQVGKNFRFFPAFYRSNIDYAAVDPNALFALSVHKKMHHHGNDQSSSQVASTDNRTLPCFEL